MSDSLDVKERKKYETQLRRAAAEMGLALRKSRARDPDRMDYGLYRIEDPETGCVVAGRFPYGYTLELDDVADVLEEIFYRRNEQQHEEARLARLAARRQEAQSE
jgi:hypothetical protein